MKSRNARRFLATALTLGLTGASLATPAQEQQFPVDGHKLDAYRAGQGQATVIFESGFGTGWHTWDKVLTPIESHAKVFAYSRAGTGQSEALKTPRDLEQSVDALEKLLAESGQKPPYILVGHSYGGLLMRAYAARHPNQVEGMVLVDPTPEGYAKRMHALNPKRADQDEATLLGFIPPKFQAEYRLISDQILKTGKLPFDAKLPDVPTVILTSTFPEIPDFQDYSPEGRKIWREEHDRMFDSVRQGSHIVTASSGHNIQKEQPELVVGAIEQVLATAKPR